MGPRRPITQSKDSADLKIHEISILAKHIISVIFGIAQREK